MFCVALVTSSTIWIFFSILSPCRVLFHLFVVISSLSQLSAFSQLQFPNGQQMVKTYRPVQPLNGRQVYRSGGHVALVSSVVLIMSVLVSSALSLQTGGWTLCFIVSLWKNTAVHWWLSNTWNIMNCILFVWIHYMQCVRFYL